MAQYKKVALVQDWLTGFAGGEQVLLALTELFPDAPIYTSIYNPKTTPQFFGKKVYTSFLQKIPGAKLKHQYFIPFMPVAFETFDLKGYDLVISLGAFAKGVITQPDQVHLNYCHTPIRYAWKLGGDNRASGRIKDKIAHNLRVWDVVSAERVDGFIANSQTVADRIKKIYRMPSTVIYPPVDIQRYQGIQRAPKDYFVALGRLVQYKRVDLIIEACLRANKHLYIIGNGPDRARLLRVANGSPLIHFLGRVEFERLEKIFSEARAAEEDFGIAPVEAMGAGCPVIAYNKGGLTESVIADQSGEFFEEQCVDSLAEVLANFSDAKYSAEKISKSVQRFDKSAFLRNIAEYIATFNNNK